MTDEPLIETRRVETVTLRDQFAMAWLTGYVASPTASNMHLADAAAYAYEMADAMLEARAK